ncbi:MAG: hypothetical protein ACRDAU_07825 [Clostridium sp.]
MTKLLSKGYLKLLVILILFISFNIICFYTKAYPAKLNNKQKKIEDHILISSIDKSYIEVSHLYKNHLKKDSFHNNAPILNFSNSHKFKKDSHFSLITKIFLILSLLIILSVICCFVFF